MLENLKLNFPNVNFIGIRIAGSGDAKRMVRMHCNHDFKKIDPICTKLTKEKTATLSDTGYDAFFLMVSTALSNSTEFEVEEGAKKSTIRSAFKKSLASKKMNKKVLNEFIAMVA
jgi:predicted GTPase